MARKAAAAGATSPGLDRHRIGERLQASLAGLQELRLLRERHRETVRKVLGEQGQDVPGAEPEEEEEEEEMVTRGDGGARSTEQSYPMGPDEMEEQPLQNCNQELIELHLGSSQDQSDFGQQNPTLDAEPLLPLSCPEAACGQGEASCARRTAAEGAGAGCPPLGRPPPPPPDGTEDADAGLARAEGGSGRPGTARAPGPQRGARGSPAAPEQHLELDGRSGEPKQLGLRTQLAEGPLDNPDSDSRPSSGFCDVSDSTSCSLSTSCTSVYSECPSSSRWSVQSLSQLPRLSGNWNRPRSTDESAVRLMDLRSQRLLCGQGARAGEGCVAGRRSKVSQRPVSTGDLNFLRHYLSVDPVGAPLSCCRGDWEPEAAPDPKYQCDLVSRNSNEVYHYPSPLHAVALQSPLFTASSSQQSSSSQEDLASGRATGAETAARPPPTAPRLLSKGRLDKYISGLVLRFRCRPASGHLTPSRPELASHPKSLSMSSVYSQSSLALGAAPLVSPVGGWKVRRRISTCCQVADRASSPSLETCRLSGPGPSLEGPFCPSESPKAESLLYRGKHLNRELVKCPATADRGLPDKSHEGGRRMEAFKRTGVGRKSGGRSCSEMSLNSAACRKPEALCGFECQPSPAKRKQKWTSVLEIPAGRCKLKRPGFLGQAQAFLSRRHWAFSADSPPSSSLRATVLEASCEHLSACRCHGNSSPGKADGGQAREWAETLPRPAVAMETRFHRSKSFKELRKKVQLSIRPWSLKVNNSSK
ncbi:dapper homolog 2-like [Heterodontus francisci]|uniref:dapper homolog 2-like n=1 Tax=Heterodontus francisci TaxID=7792 RepID=UPI00355AD865